MASGDRLATRLRKGAWVRQKTGRDAIEIAAAVGAGIVFGAIVMVSRELPIEWATVVIIASMAPTVALLVKDMRKLLLIAFVVDIPLGFDITLQYQEGHLGGPPGLLMSLMTVAIAVGYALWISERKPRLEFFPAITVPALLYLLMIVVSLFQARNLQLGLFGLFLQCQFFLMYLYLANHVITWDDVRLVMVTAVLCLLFEAALMVVQYYTGTEVAIGAIASHASDGAASAGATGPRVGGTIGNANSAACYLAAALLLTFATYLGGGLANTGLIAAAGSLGIVALIATASRTAWASLALSTSLLMTQVIQTPAGKRAIAILLVGVLLMGVLFGAQITKRVSTLTTDTTRQELAYMALNIIRDYPLGVGENNYDQVMSDKYAHPKWIGHNLLPVHNKYLLVWADTGLQGLIAFALMLLSTAGLAVRRLFIRGLPAPTRILLGGFLCALCGYAFHMNTEGFSSRSNVQILWFLMAMIAALSRLALQQAPAKEPAGLAAGHQRT
jgi:O-antigen ligase